MNQPPLPGRDLIGDELRELATWLGDRPEIWRHMVRHDPAQRTFHRLVTDEHVCVWLICWMPGQDTGFHDHDGSAGAVAVLEARSRSSAPASWARR
jgi:predicted metal-dependent enzyme (double-stranded beta helix superfamily)